MGFPWTHIGGATAAVANRYVTSVAMKVGAYALANAVPPTNGGRLVTLTRSAVGTADTPGTIVIVGTDAGGATITETLTPGADGVLVTGTRYFATIISITGVGWVIDAVEGTADTIVIGCAAAAILAEGTGVLHGIQINTTSASTIVVADARGTIATLPANIAAGTFYRWDIDWSGYLSVTVNGASDITVMHTGSLPSSYSMA